MKTSSIIVKTESKSYPIYFGNDFTNTLDGIRSKTSSADEASSVLSTYLIS